MLLFGVRNFVNLRCMKVSAECNISSSSTYILPPPTGKDEKDSLYCTYCNRRTRETCFQLKGYPDWHPKSKAHVVTSVVPSSDASPQCTVPQAGKVLQIWQ
ncbi:hypothetical protein ACFX11_032937 [Malus domestica]